MSYSIHDLHLDAAMERQEHEAEQADALWSAANEKAASAMADGLSDVSMAFIFGKVDQFFNEDMSDDHFGALNNMLVNIALGMPFDNDNELISDIRELIEKELTEKFLGEEE